MLQIWEFGVFFLELNFLCNSLEIRSANSSRLGCVICCSRSTISGDLRAAARQKIKWSGFISGPIVEWSVVKPDLGITVIWHSHFPCVIGDHLLPLFINKWPCTWCSQWPSCSTKRSSQCPVHWTIMGAGVMQIRTHSWHLREISSLRWPIMTSWYGHTFCITGLLWIHRSAVDYPHKKSVTWRHPSVSMLVFVYQKPPRLILCGSTIWSLFRIASLGCKSNSMVCQILFKEFNDCERIEDKSSPVFGTQTKVDIDFNGNAIEQVESYKYLGNIMNTVHSYKADVVSKNYEYLSGQSRKAMFSIKKTLKSIGSAPSSDTNARIRESCASYPVVRQRCLGCKCVYWYDKWRAILPLYALCSKCEIYYKQCYRCWRVWPNVSEYILSNKCPVISEKTSGAAWY